MARTPSKRWRSVVEKYVQSAEGFINNQQLTAAQADKEG